jgi:RimJ/RimL family protein N-acetyltransferase
MMTAANPIPAHSRTQSWSIRCLRIEDAAQLQRHCFTQLPLTTVQDFIRRTSERIAHSRGVAFVAVTSQTQEVIAFGQLLQWKDCAEISDLIVAEAWHGQGIGTQLIHTLIQHATKLNVDCIEIGAAINNPRALALYLRLGFQLGEVQHLDVGNGIEPIQYLKMSLNT